MVPLSGLGNAFDVTYDALSEEIFILEHTNHAKTLAQITTDSAISRSPVNGGNKTKMFSSAVPDDSYCLGFDWNGRNLVVGNKVSQTIEIISTRGKQYRSVILSNDQSPTAVVTPVSIAVDADKGYVFWLDRGGGASDAKVARAGLDGSNPLVIASNDLAELDHIALDTTNQRVYFSEAKAGRVSFHIFRDFLNSY